MADICSVGADLRRGDPERCGHQARWRATLKKSKAVYFACCETHQAVFDEVLLGLVWVRLDNDVYLSAADAGPD